MVSNQMFSQNFQKSAYSKRLSKQKISVKHLLETTLHLSYIKHIDIFIYLDALHSTSFLEFYFET